MDSQEKYEYWLDSAQYDLATAEAMIRSGRWVYVAFMCQQAVEKLVKGLYVLYIDDNIPRTHNIRALVERIDSKFPEPLKEEHYNLFDELTMYYLNGRYTNYKQKLGERLNEQEAKGLLSLTKEAFACLLIAES
jgi:HEPN domain-containing protein